MDKLAKALLTDFYLKDRGSLNREEYTELIRQEIKEAQAEAEQQTKEIIEHIVQTTIAQHGKTQTAKEALREYAFYINTPQLQQYANECWQRA